MTRLIDDAAALTPEIRGELMRSMKAAIEQALSEVAFDSPPRLLTRVAWSFVGEPFPTRAAFARAIREYQQGLDLRSAWIPDAVVLPRPCLVVCIDAEDTGDDFLREIAVQSADGGPLRALDVMFTLHQALVGLLRESRYHFFEGLTLDPDRPGDHYRLNLGS